MIPWHRLFGTALTDFFTGTSFRVELERDLSLKQQFLDAVIIERDEGQPPEDIPDGLENLGVHNLMTYKSHQQSLDVWALDELTGHYVNYRKLISPSPDRLLPVRDFRLYAVCTRYPAGLAEYAELKNVKEGVYDVRWGGSIIRMIVLGRIQENRSNALWNLFSAVPEKAVSGASGYRWKTPVSSVINELFRKYKTEGVIAMPYTIEDFQRDYAREYLDRLTPDEILKNYPMEKILKNLSPDERLKGISDNELKELIKKRFSEKEREEILRMLTE